MQAQQKLVSPQDAGAMKADPGSFRDRSNRIYRHGQEIYRGVDQQSLQNWRALKSTDFFAELLDEGKVVQTTEASKMPAMNESSSWAGHLAHERIPFISYPYEWSFNMLKDAALLHLEILERALEEGWTLKDASAYNIQWIGSRPVFIDIPSFVPRIEGEPWPGYRQFCMMFLYPLMFRAYKNIDYVPFLRSSLEGIDPAQADRILAGATRFRKGVLGHVYLHSRMAGRAKVQDLDEAKSLTETAAKSGPAKQNRSSHSFAMVMGVLQGLRRTVERLRVDDSRTTWGNYDTEHSYAASSLDSKQEFVRKHVLARHRTLAWDLGCNTGTYSRICAQNTDYVIAADGDEKAIYRLFNEQVASKGTRILPLVMDLANISPNQGWNGRERQAFDHRAKPELILCLALIHHIVISANIPLEQFLAWLRSFDCEVIIEFVGLQDDMTRMLLRNRVNQYAELEEKSFEASMARFFDTKDALPIKGGQRKMFFLAPR